MFSPVPTSPPDWFAWAFLGLLIVPHLFVIAAGRPDWVRYITWAQLALTGLTFVRALIRPIPIFGLVQIISLILLAIVVLAISGLAKFLAGKTRRHLWCAHPHTQNQNKQEA